MTALIPAEPRTGGRHRLDEAGPSCFRVHPPRHYRSTSHRLSRRRVMQLRVGDLTRKPHSLAVPRRPWWQRALIGAGWLFVVLFETREEHA